MSKVKPWPSLDVKKMKVAIALKSNSWESPEKIAQNLELPINEVLEILNYFKENQLVFPVIYPNWNKTTYNFFAIFFTWREGVVEEDIQSFMSKISNDPSTVYVYETKGDYQGSIGVASTSESFLETPFYKNHIEESSLINNIKILNMTYLFKESSRFYTEEQWGMIDYYYYKDNNEKLIIDSYVPPYIKNKTSDFSLEEAVSNKVIMDSLDYQILTILFKSPLASSEKLAEQLACSVEEVENRKARLIKEKVIIPTSYFRDSGYTWYQILINIKDPSMKEEALKTILQKPIFCTVSSVSGGHDLALGCHIEDPLEMEKVLTHLKEEEGLIKDYTVLSTSWIYKYNTIVIGERSSTQNNSMKKFEPVVPWG